MLRFLQEIVVSLVEESATMPAGVLDCLLGQITGSKDVSLPIPLDSSAEVCLAWYTSLAYRFASLPSGYGCSDGGGPSLPSSFAVGEAWNVPDNEKSSPRLVPAYRQHLQRTRKAAG